MNYRKYNNLLNHVRIPDLKRFIASKTGGKGYDDGLTYPREVKTIMDKKKFFEQFKDFELDDTFQITVGGLKVIPRSNIGKVLKEEYYDGSSGLRGQTLFYNYIRSKYLNISRDDVVDWMSKQQLYQVTKPKVGIKVQVKKYKKVNAAWYMDLIDMGHYPSGNNRGYRYIVSVLDAFTRQCHLLPIRNKTPLDIWKAMEAFMNDENKPRVLISDQGSEFRGEFERFLGNLGVRHITSNSYTPVPDIENLNRQVRMILSKLFVKSDSFVWWDKLGLIQDNINKYNSLSAKDGNAVNDNNVERIGYDVGQKVRVLMSVFHSGIRKLNKEGLGKHSHLNYTVSIFEITKKIRSGHANALPMYHLKTSDGYEIVSNETGKPFHFKHNDLLAIETSMNNMIRKDGFIVRNAIK